MKRTENEAFRCGEAPSLMVEWPEVETDPSVLRVPPHGKHRRKALVVPLVPKAVEILTRRLNELPGGAKDTPLVLQGDYLKTWVAASKTIGYETRVSLRDLRHTWGTLAGRTV